MTEAAEYFIPVSFVTTSSLNVIILESENLGEKISRVTRDTTVTTADVGVSRPERLLPTNVGSGALGMNTKHSTTNIGFCAATHTHTRDEIPVLRAYSVSFSRSPEFRQGREQHADMIWPAVVIAWSQACVLWGGPAGGDRQGLPPSPRVYTPVSSTPHTPWSTQQSSRRIGGWVSPCFFRFEREVKV